MKELTIKECHNVLLDIASVFDTICKRHQIPYYMIGGTMLGAFRHKGFIPWDDDMDFGVERPYFPKLIQALSEELPDHLHLRKLDNCTHFVSNFIKIEDDRTLIYEEWDDHARDMGVFIDIFPLDRGRRNSFQTKLFASYVFFLLKLKDYLYYDPKFRRGIKKIIATIMRKSNICSYKQTLAYVERLLKRYTTDNSPYLVTYYGNWRQKEIMRQEVFGQPQSYPFETITLSGVANADAYLSSLYGNYMQPPPEEKRLFHYFGKFYK